MTRPGEIWVALDRCGLEPTPAGLLGREGSLATGLDDDDLLKRLKRARISHDLGGERR